MSQEQHPASAAQTQIRKEKSVRDPDAHQMGEKEKEDAFPRFRKALQQLNFDAIASVATSVRQSNINISNDGNDATITPPLINCTVDKESSSGSYNIVHQIAFEDGVRWMLKVPHNGHTDCWDSLAAQALISEANTMRLIKDRTEVPLPAVYHFDASLDNEIGCPYILMEFVEGIPLYKAWFNNEASETKQESVRLRALQTTAAAMVQLSQMKFEKGGAVVTDPETGGINVVNIRAANNHAMWNRLQAGNNEDQTEELYCAKEPTSNPLSQVLCMLRRHGAFFQAQALDRGGYKALEILTQWAFERLNTDNEKFVLAHPDLDTQNIFVKEDGTLCGIIDWDGVAAVPFLVGSLKLPVWLTRDWNPTYYNYNVETGGPISPDGRRENSPEELGKYRATYAQFIEMSLLNGGGDAEQSRQTALITRASLALGNLENAVDNPWLTIANVKHLFGEVNDVAEALGLDDALKSVDETLVDDDEDNENDDDVDDDDDDENCDEESDEEACSEGRRDDTKSTELEQSGIDTGNAINEVPTHCPRCLADMREELEDSAGPTETSSYTGGDTSLGTIRHQMSDTMTSNSEQLPNLPQEADSIMVPMDSRKARLGKAVCYWGERGCRRLARTLHRNNEMETSQAEPTVTVQKSSGRESSKARKIGALCEHAQQRLRKLSETLHRQNKETLESQYDLKGSSAKQFWVERVLSVLGKLLDQLRIALYTDLSKGSNDACSNEDVEADAELINNEAFSNHQGKLQTSNQLESRPIESPKPEEFEHAKDCPKAAKINDEANSRINLSDVWDRITLELESAGVPFAMIKENQATIAGNIINEMKEKIRAAKLQEEMQEYLRMVEAAKEAEQRKKARKAAKKAKKALKATKLAEEKSAAENDAENDSSTKPKQEAGLKSNAPPDDTPAGGRKVPVLSKSDQEQRSKTEETVTAKPVGLPNNAAGKPADTPQSKAPQLEGPETAVNTAAAAPVYTEGGTLIPRNKPCPCGSTHKFKKCCGRVQYPVKEQVETEKLNASDSAIRSKTDELDVVQADASDEPHAEIAQNQDEAASVGMSKVEDCEKAEALPSPDLLQKEDPTWKLDEGGMGMREIFVALGRDNLDDRRRALLRLQFETMLDVVMGLK